MEIKYKNTSGTLTLYMYGELDECSASKVKNAVDRLFLDTTDVQKVIFDLSGVTFMDSTGIGLLIGRYKKFKSFNVPSYITGATLPTEKVILLAGLYQIMPKY